MFYFGDLSQRIALRLTKEQLEFLSERASDLNISVSNYIRKIIDTHIREVLSYEHVINDFNGCV